MHSCAAATHPSTQPSGGEGGHPTFLACFWLTELHSTATQPVETHHGSQHPLPCRVAAVNLLAPGPTQRRHISRAGSIPQCNKLEHRRQVVAACVCRAHHHCLHLCRGEAAQQHTLWAANACGGTAAKQAGKGVGRPPTVQLHNHPEQTRGSVRTHHSLLLLCQWAARKQV